MVNAKLHVKLTSTCIIAIFTMYVPFRLHAKYTRYICEATPSFVKCEL